MALTGRIILDIALTLTNPSDLSTPHDELKRRYAQDWQNGAGANQANMMWHDRRQLAASATEQLDLSGVLTRAFGGSLTLTKVKTIIIHALASNVNAVRITRPANGIELFLAAGDGLDLPPGGLFVYQAPNAAGIAVTDATADLLSIANAGAGSAVDYEIVVVGAE